MSTPTTNKLTELEIVIPKDKFNDMGFIFRKLMETSLDVLDVIAKNSDKELVDLVAEFLPDLKNLSQPDIFLSKWGLTMLMIECKSSKLTNTSDDTVGVEVDESNTSSTTSSVSSKKKIKKKLTLSKKTKTVKSINNTPETSTISPEKADNSKDEKPTAPKVVTKKLKKIKLSKPSSSNTSVSSSSTTGSNKPKKKLKLKKKKKIASE